MRKLVTICILALSEFSFGQNPPAIEFSQGNDNFQSFMFKQLGHGKNSYSSLDTASKYMTIIIDFDKAGNILQETVVSISDDSLGKILTRAIEQTQGMWVNHSGTNQTAVLPVYWEYDDIKSIHHTISSMDTEKWIKSNRANLIFLKPLKAEFGKPVR